MIVYTVLRLARFLRQSTDKLQTNLQKGVLIMELMSSTDLANCLDSANTELTLPSSAMSVI